VRGEAQDTRAHHRQKVREIRHHSDLGLRRNRSKRDPRRLFRDKRDAHDRKPGKQRLSFDTQGARGDDNVDRFGPVPGQLFRGSGDDLVAGAKEGADIVRVGGRRVVERSQHQHAYMLWTE